MQERLFWAAFDQAHPRILGALLTAVSTALRNIDQTKLDRLPRMADFALWVAAAEPSLPWDQGGFMDAYEGNRADVVECSLDADPVACAVRSLMANASRWTGTATDLMGILKGHVPDDATREKRWPKLPHILSMRLRRSSTFLRKVGIDVRFEPREGATGIRLIEIVNKKG